MNRRILAAGLAAAVLGGIVVVVIPQHAMSVARVCAAVVAVVAGALVLGAVGPFVTEEPGESELDVVPTAGAAPLDPHGLRDARRDLDRPAAAGSIPPDVWDRLVVAARVRFQRVGIDLDDPRSATRAGDLLRPDTVRLLSTRPAAGTVRNPVAAAGVVHRVLDELSTIERSIGASHGHH